MRDIVIAFRNVLSYRSRVTGIAVLTVLGCVVGLAVSGVVAQAAQASPHEISQGAELRSIDVVSNMDRPDAKSLTTDGIRRITAMAHVSDVQPWTQASFGIKNDKIGGALLYGTIPRAGALPPIVKSSRDNLFPLHAGEAVLPNSSQGMNLTSLFGQSVQVSYTRKVAEGTGESAADTIKVVGLYDASHAQDGPSAAYVDPGLVVRWAAAKAGVPADQFLGTVGYQKATVLVDQSAAVPAVLDAIHAAGFDATSVQQRLQALSPPLEVLRGLSYVVIALLLGFSLVAGLTLASGFLRQRTKEIGLLKAAGFPQGRVFRLFLLELLLVGLTSTVVGVLLGNLTSVGLGALLSGRSAFGVTFPEIVAWPDPAWSVFALLAPPAAIVVGGLLPARRAAAMRL